MLICGFTGWAIEIWPRTSSTVAPASAAAFAIAEKKRADQFVVGFAAETADLVQNANKKLKSKNADMIIANSVAGNNGAFGSDLNQVTILQLGTEPVQWSRMTKTEVAIKLIQLLATKIK